MNEAGHVPGPIRVLIVEDVEADVERVLAELRRAGFVPTAHRAQTEAEYLDLVSRGVDVILAESHLPMFDAARALHLVQERDLDIPFIVVSGSLSDEDAMACLKQGADDYLLKDRLARLGSAVSRALEKRELRAAARRADAALQEHEARCRLISETVPDAIFMEDVEGRLLFGNRAAEKLSGYSRDELLGRPVASMLSVEHARESPARLGAAPSRQVVSPWIEAEILRKDGMRVSVEAHVADVSKDGHTVGRIGVVRDLTERRKSEQQLWLQDIALEAAANAIVVTDRQGIIVRVNRAFTELTGYTSREAIGQTPRLLKSGRQDAAVYARLWSTILSKRAWQGEVINRRKNGELYVEEQTITPVCDGRGEITHFISIKQDVTARKEAEEALRRSEASYRSLVENAPVGIYRSRADGALLAVNPAIVTMLGYDSSAELLARNLSTDVYRDQAERVRAIELRRKGVAQTFDVQWKRKDGTVLTVQTSGRALKDEKSGDEVFEVFVQDATQQRCAEARARQAEKLTMLGSLVSGVAHELNNPLTAVTGFAHLLQSDPDLPARARRRAERVNLSALRAAKIVKNLLTFARQQPPELGHVRLAELMDQALELLEYQLRVNNVEVVKQFAADVPEITADRDQLLQVFLNIVQNAMHAMTASEGRKIVTRILSHPAGARLEFQDTGPGIPPALIGRIFEPFFTTKPPGQGTGLGLSICYGIVKGHGGELLAENVPEGGARFVVMLPVGAQSTSAASEEAEEGQAAPRVGAARVLVVDDEPEILSLMADVLGGLGDRAQMVTSGRAALDRLERGEHFDAIIVDVRMPNMDGPTLYREIVRRFPDAGRRVIFCTGDVVNPGTHEFLKGAGRPVVTKPFDPGAIERVVSGVLQEGARLASEPASPPDRLGPRGDSR